MVFFMDMDRIQDHGLLELMQEALSLKLRYRGDRMGLCTISNARSGACSEDCAFCAQSVSARGAQSPVYPLKSADELVMEAETAAESGAERFSIVTSGRGPSERMVEEVAERVWAIRDKVGIRVCCSLGIMGKRKIKILKDAGVTRYHHNLEASREFFPAICSTHSFKERVATIQAARQCGLEVCSGGIIGLGEAEKDRISMAQTLSDLGVDSVPINILVPIRGTRLQDLPTMGLSEILRVVAMFRIIMPRCAIRIAGGRETALGEFQALAFMAGADAMLIGGYLTTRGRPPGMDLALTQEIRQLWKEMYLP